MRNDLDQLYFDRVHVFAPIMQKYRYRTWSRQPDKSKQRKCLQYAMWLLAASFSSQFQFARNDLHRKTRQLLNSLEANGQDSPVQSQTPSIEQVQAWVMITLYEITSDTTNYQCGMMSAGRAFRLIQILRLYEIDRPDNPGLHGDWVDIESMRRTFWLAYTIDRLTSVMDCFQLTFDERQIRTRLPAPDINFTSGRPTNMCFLSEMIPRVDSQWLNDRPSYFSESIIVATLCGRILEHKQIPHITRQKDHSPHHSPLQNHEPNSDATYQFCSRHRTLVAMAIQQIGVLRRHISSPPEHPDPTLIFLALVAHMASFMLQEILESKPLGTDAQGTQLTDVLLMEHKQKTMDAIRELGVFVAALGQLNHFQTHPFTPIPLLLCARFLQSHTSLNQAYSALLPGITAVLRELNHLNGLALSSLKILGLDKEDPHVPI
ncbi:fungal-specific transcription factor domain-containing protein [Xylariaceae sp. FL0016]|nr:fungal-specific transcription factor domain-containing protein [Xylariaceae sp. FL0016]